MDVGLSSSYRYRQGTEGLLLSMVVEIIGLVLTLAADST